MILHLLYLLIVFLTIKLEQMGKGVAVPLDQFIKVELHGVADMKKRLEKARDAYDAAQLKYDVIKSSKKKRDQADKVRPRNEWKGEGKRC